jgi:hypothetical protein
MPIKIACCLVVNLLSTHDLFQGKLSELQENYPNEVALITNNGSHTEKLILQS